MILGDSEYMCKLYIPWIAERLMLAARPKNLPDAAIYSETIRKFQRIVEIWQKASPHNALGLSTSGFNYIHVPLVDLEWFLECTQGVGEEEENLEGIRA